MGGCDSGSLGCTHGWLRRWIRRARWRWRDDQGSLLLTDDNLAGEGVTDCGGQGGYSDLGPGADVTVTNESGDIVGTSQLELNDTTSDVAARMSADGFGSLDEVKSLLDTVSDFPVLCPMYFDVEVEKAKFYSVEIGNRGQRRQSKSDLEKSDWHVVYTIGDLSGL